MTAKSRALEERDQLSERIVKLSAFIDNSDEFDTLSVAVRSLLCQQLTHMTAYLGVLHARIGFMED